MRSFIKWVGSKQQLLGEIIPRIPPFSVYVEPFCGSASVFFSLFESLDSNMFEEKPTAMLADWNVLLINTLRTVERDLDALVDILGWFEAQHALDPQGFYKSQAARIGSPEKAIKDAEQRGHDGGWHVDVAALFTYLNKTAFNGIWRLNSSGHFNTPWNQKTKVSLVSRQLKDCSYLLGRYADILRAPFQYSINCQDEFKKTFFFLDPPYIPLSETSSFVGYTQEGWGEKDNLSLLEHMNDIDRAGGKFMMTNSTAPLVKELFGKFNIVEVEASRMVKASADRPKVKESLIMNY